MLVNDQSTILQSVLESLLPILDKKVLVLFTGGSDEPTTLLSIVDSLLATEAKIAISPAFSRIAPKEFLQKIRSRQLKSESEVRAFLCNAHLTVIPVLTRNSLAKVALGIQDTLVTNAIAATLMQSIPMIAVKENYHPASQDTKAKGYDTNQAYNAMFLDYEKKLVTLGATLVEGSEFSKAVKSTLYPWLQSREKENFYAKEATTWKATSELVLTRADVPLLPQGSILEIPCNTVVTPLAVEQIERQKLIIRRT